MKLAVIGTPQIDQEDMHLQQMTSVARITDATTFTRLCYGGFHQRGGDGAEAIASVSDGADWIQTLIGAYHPDAVRILDAMHACQRLAAISQHLFLGRPEVAERWYQRMKERLLTGRAETVLLRLRRWVAVRPSHRRWMILAKRASMLLYADWRAAGWPIGSGSAESGHRHIMQARLKGAGLPWEVPHANAVLALRCLDTESRARVGVIPSLVESSRFPL
jgi:hypothetical protein